MDDDGREILFKVKHDRATWITEGSSVIIKFGGWLILDNISEGREVPNRT